MTSKQALDNLLKQGLEVGSKVRVTKKTNPEGYHETWMKSMDEWIGQELTVCSIIEDQDQTSLLLEKNSVEDRWYFPATSVELVQSTSKKLTVDEDFVRQAHEAACSDWKQKIEEQFPDLFPGYYKFGKKFELSTMINGPLGIAFGCAPTGLEHQCLVVASGYELEVRHHNGYQLLFFKEKK